MKLPADEALAWIMRGRRVPRRNWAPDMGPDLQGAQRDLSSAVTSKRVQAWGRRGPNGSYELMPCEIFRKRGYGLVVSPYGNLDLAPAQRIVEYAKDVRAGGGLDARGLWHEIEFDESEIKKAFPARPSPSAAAWMLAEAKKCADAGALGKRDVMVQECMQALGCTRRQALGAYAELPGHLRRSRGKPAVTRGR